MDSNMHLDLLRSLFRTGVSDTAQKLFIWFWHLVGCSPGVIERVSSCDLAYDFGKTSDATRKHIKQLEDAGLIEVERDRGDLRITVRLPDNGPPPRREIPGQKIFDFAGEIGSDSDGEKDRQNGGQSKQVESAQNPVLEQIAAKPENRPPEPPPPNTPKGVVQK